MHLIGSVLLSIAVLAHSAPSPCDLPSLAEVGSQYLVFGQDCRQYAYGYNAGSSAKVEIMTANGTVIGAYHYIDANNVTQTVNYTANDVDGFVVDASNLPVPVEVATVTEDATTLAPSPAENEISPLVRDSITELPKDQQVLFKPIISVWLPASPYNHGRVPVQQAEISGTKYRN